MASHDPTFAQRPVLKLLRPFVRFAQLESSSSIVLLLATAAALFLANSRFAPAYNALLEIPLGLFAGHAGLAWPLSAWIDDVLMAVFFLVVGLEVKRELLVGELASVRRAILPVLGAVGGMLVPATIFWTLNHGTASGRGWGIPIATDIAFSLAILAAFGTRLPLALRIFLASLAIADDVGGVLVIAVAYTRNLHLGWVAVSVGLFLVCLGLNRLGVTQLSAYLAVGALLWISLHDSGIHPTLSGILLALAVPSRGFLPAGRFVEHGHIRLEEFAEAHTRDGHGAEEREHLSSLRSGLQLVESPLDRLQQTLGWWVSFGIMPLFALANAGIPLRGFHARFLLHPVFAGVALGLILGKPLGITLFSWAAVRLGIAELPRGVTWGHLHAASWVAGIGFTVAIFIAGLAFGAGQRYTETRIAILFASTLAALIGTVLLRLTPPRGTASSGARHAV